jgi:SecD/SecF fusion protein
MQSKGKLSSVLAGVIAVFLILVCGFYLSFTYVNSKFEDQAESYAKAHSVNGSDDDYNGAYKHYMDSVGEEKVYLGYTLEDVRKWGVNLGLDLKGGMNVILQVDMPDMLRQMSSIKNDSTFEKALAVTAKAVQDDPSKNDDFIGLFVKEYKTLKPTADLSVVFTNVKNGSNDAQAISQIKEDIKSMVNTSATQTLRKRIDGFGVVSPNIQVLEGKDGQILLELPGVKDHERVRELLQRSANLEFYTTYKAGDVLNGLAQLASVQDSTLDTRALQEMLAKSQGMISPDYTIVGYAADDFAMKAIDNVINSQYFARYLPSDLVLRWGVKADTRQSGEGENVQEVKIGYALYALKLSNGGKPALDGEVVKSASADYDSKGFRGNEVSMEMNAEGAREWARITAANVGKPIAIVLDDRVYSAPNVNGAITEGRSSITGNFTVEEAKDLANVLTAGKMKAKVDIISDMVIGPSLGQQAINAGMISFVVALVLLMIFMICFYGFIPGMVANLCLIFNLFFTFGILASFQAVLTLSGICGIVLSLGMAVDANVLIFERAKEELRAGKNARTAIADGYSNAFSAIFDSNLTSIITGVILMYFGTGPIKGFATTLIIGIICSFFTAVYLSRLFFMWFGKATAKQTFTTAISRKMFTDSSINFLGKRKISFTVAIAIIVIFIVSLFTRGLNNGIDFSGGRNYVVKFEQPVNPVEVQNILDKTFEGSQVSVITIESSNQIRVSTNYKIDNSGDEKVTEQEITDKLYNALKPYLGNITPEQFSTTDASRGIVSSQKVGPTVADDMKTDAYIAVTFAIIAMFIYILVRFKNIAFSVGAVSAVAFTAFFIIGLYSLCQGVFPFAMEIDQNFIAAILTVIGYQINDTVVVFDRVRENVGLYPKQDFFTTINRSLNSTLGRTIMTSVSTLLVLVVIFILGGDSIRSFVFAMMLGVIVGTCASIFIASPVAYLTDARRKNKAAKAEK